MTDLDRRILTKACGLEPDKILPLPDGTWTERYPTFTTADDWELVRVKVVHSYLNDCIDYIDKRVSIADPPRQLCEVTCNWIKSRPDLFPWVDKVEEGNG